MKYILLVSTLALAGCASSGLYTMSDDWCSAHPEASPARCNRNPLHEVDVQGHQQSCGDNIMYYAGGTPILCMPIRRGE